MSYTTVIGLEVHVQLNTISKAFSGDLNAFGADANHNVSPITLAHPGTLPRINKKQVDAAVKLGLALESKINQYSIFDRKHYFYPDLPKGYQITQETLPICVGGQMNFISDGKPKSIRIHHVHMEEDAGKSIHDQDERSSLVDFNRAGTPLLEIVTEPDFRSAQEVFDFISAMQRLVRYLEISDGNMEEGSLRCDCNVSVMPLNTQEYGERCEIKNVNSKRFARTSIAYEAKRQIAILESGEKVKRSTLLFNPVNGTTSPMRSKEDVNDYRYFPDPDLPPVIVKQDEIDAIKDSIDLLPKDVFDILIEKYKLTPENALLISEEKDRAKLFYRFMALDVPHHDLSNLFINKVLPFLGESGISPSEYQVPATGITSMFSLISEGKLAKSAAYQHLIPELLKGEERDIQALAESLNILLSPDQSFVDDLISEVLHKYPDKVTAYQNGKKGLIGFFMGEIMKASKGKANAAEVKPLLESFLSNS